MRFPKFFYFCVLAASLLLGGLGILLVKEYFWVEEPNSNKQLLLGKSVYLDNCASCHGKNLQGQENWQSMNLDGTTPAPPHDDSGHTWHHGDQLLFDYTKKGGQEVIGGDFKSGMPGFGEILSDKEIWAVIEFIKSNWSETNKKRQEMISSTERK